MIAEAIYALCALTSLAAAVLLLRQYRRRRTPLLWWSFVCFAGLAVNNLFVFLDLAVLPATDLSLPRSAAGAVAMIALVYGLVRESHS